MLSETTEMAMFSSLIDEIQDPPVPRLVNRKLKALTRITDLFMAGSGRHSKSQLELFDEIFKTLVAAIELKTRIRLAQQLAAVPETPGTLARALAFDSDIAVAGPVLSRSASLTDSDLVVNASTQSQDHLHAIAQRQTIGEAVTEILIERGEPRVVHTVAKNAGARISDGSFRELVVRAGDDASLALHIGKRRDIPRHHFLKLLETASASVRTRIAAANPRFADEVQDAVTEVVDDINLEVRRSLRITSRRNRGSSGFWSGRISAKPMFMPPRARRTLNEPWWRSRRSPTVPSKWPNARSSAITQAWCR